MATISNQIPTFDEELLLRHQGYSTIAGLDEVGRGPLAGPVVAGVAILPLDLDRDIQIRINDSKQLTQKQRDSVVPLLRQYSLGLETGSSSHVEIDDLGITKATQLAMKRALDNLVLTPQFLLLDAFPLPDINIPQKPIIHGDSISLSVAAASIVAKVERDQVMVKAHEQYPEYGFDRNKGYGSRHHLMALEKIGPCPLHRYSFSPIRR